MQINININERQSLLFPLGWAGYSFNIIWLCVAVLILLNLEKTYRASSGAIRWQIKFMILGIGSLFAVRIYTMSQGLLFALINPGMNIFQAVVLLLSCVFITLSFLRTRQWDINIYVSRGFLFNSAVLLIVGIYLIVVGIAAKVMLYWDKANAIQHQALLVFLLLIGLIIILLSDDFRHRLGDFITRNFERPLYDYRHEWRKFTQRTTALMDVKDLGCDLQNGWRGLWSILGFNLAGRRRKWENGFLGDRHPWHPWMGNFLNSLQRILRGFGKHCNNRLPLI